MHDAMANPDAVGGDFGRTVKHAVFWRSGSQIVAQLITWGATLVVLWLLDPSDYGIFAMTQTLIQLLNFLNGYGFASSLIQRESISTHAVRQAFGLLLLLNCALAALQYAIAPMVAAYYGHPILADLLRVQCLIFLALPFMIVPDVLLSRRMDFRRIAIVNLASAVISASVALYCAWHGFGVWTLVIAPIAAFWSRAILLLLATRLFVLPSFDFRGAGAMAQFGSAMLASQLLWILQTQSDVFFAGRRFDEHDVGIYAQALFLTQLFLSKFVPPLNDVAFPAYSRLQGDPGAMRWSFLKSVRLIMLVACPVYLGMAVTAGPLIGTVLAPKWSEMAPLVTLLALAMPLMTLQTLFAPATTGLGWPQISVRTAACGAALFMAAFAIGVQYGPAGLAWAWLGASPLLLAATIMLSRPALGVGFRDVAQAALPGLGCALIMAILVEGIALLLQATMPGLPAPLMLGLLVASGVISYAALLWMRERETLQEMIRLVKRPPAQG